MNPLRSPFLLISSFALVLLVAATGCAKRAETTAPDAAPAKHQHHPPHGGTPVVLGDELFHVELVRDPATGTLSAYVLDDEMEEFVRIAAPSITIDATVNGEKRHLTLSPVASSATGETVGNTSQFEGSANWLKTADKFDATLEPLTVHGTAFPATPFNFPNGNDKE